MDIEDTTNVADSPTTKFIYLCSRCNMKFDKLSSFNCHMNRKYLCVAKNEYNLDYYCLKNIIVIREKYKLLREYANEEVGVANPKTDFDKKYRLLSTFYQKTNKLLMMIEADRNLTPSITDDMIVELKNYLNNCKMGQFD